jgi:hypothetical protein
MTKFFKTGLLLMAMTISLVSCRETNTADDDDLRTEAGADINISEDGSKVKIKTDDSKVKIKTDDDGNVTKKVKTDDN